MSMEYIARIDIGKKLTKEEIATMCDAGKEDEIELFDSDRGALSVWSKSMWNIDDERIIKIDINEINEAYKMAVEKYGDKAEIIFSLTIN